MAPTEPVAVAYGLELSGPLVDRQLRTLLAVSRRSWPQVSLQWESATASSGNEVLEADHARLRCLFGGHLVADRLAMSATFHDTACPDFHVVAHPGLAGVGLVFARWLGRSAFHGGVFLSGDGAWGLLAAKGRGKTTTLAALALAKQQVLADDLAVVQGGTVLTGPRTLDLRPPAAEQLEGDFRLVSVRGAERRRMVLGPAVDSAPLRGWIHLGLASRTSVVTIPPAQRLAKLAEHLAVRLVPRDPTAFLDLAALPAYQINRPLSWDALPGVVSAIEEITGREAALATAR